MAAISWTPARHYNDPAALRQPLVAGRCPVAL
jgi:hypothetical protein